MLGYAFCGSFCTLSKSLETLRELVAAGETVQPIISERAYSTDTRFFLAEEFVRRVEEITGRAVIHTVEDAEPLGPRTPLDALIIAPCTGNTLAKIAHGITDSAVTMAAKAHLRCDRPLLIALATNDGMSQNLGNIGKLLTRKSVYFVPMCQDDPRGKPYSLVADMKRIPEALSAMRKEKQLRPIFV
jgi:dipicolinate synthase subunit B